MIVVKIIVCTITVTNQLGGTTDAGMMSDLGMSFKFDQMQVHPCPLYINKLVYSAPGSLF